MSWTLLSTLAIHWTGKGGSRSESKSGTAHADNNGAMEDQIFIMNHISRSLCVKMLTAWRFVGTPKKFARFETHSLFFAAVVFTETCCSRRSSNSAAASFLRAAAAAEACAVA